MIKSYIVFIALSLLVTYAVAQESVMTADEFIRKLFLDTDASAANLTQTPTSNSTPAPCSQGSECVSPVLCVNGIISVENIPVDPRRNFQPCTSPDVCCMLKPKTGVSTDLQPPPHEPPVVNSTAKPGMSFKSCGANRECVARTICNNGKVSTDMIPIDLRQNFLECPYNEECCEIPNAGTKPVVVRVPEIKNIGCGYRNPEGFIYNITGDVNGESKFGEFPWVIAISEKVAGQHQYLCGGALIAPTVVITSHHNIVNKSADNLMVRAGEWDMETKSTAIPYQNRFVAEIITHEDYVGGNAQYNDIAILILSTPFEYQATIQPICLPQANINFDGARCMVAGWGKNRFGRDGRYQKILKKIELPVVPRAQCEADLRLTRLSKYFDLHESVICAGGEKNIDACTGDGGAPLMCPIVGGAANRYYHAGIVSWGIQCGVERVPGVYASIPYLRDWINRKLMEKNIDFKHFTP